MLRQFLCMCVYVVLIKPLVQLIEFTEVFFCFLLMHFFQTLPRIFQPAVKWSLLTPIFRGTFYDPEPICSCWTDISWGVLDLNTLNKCFLIPIPRELKYTLGLAGKGLVTSRLNETKADAHYMNHNINSDHFSQVKLITIRRWTRGKRRKTH